MKAVLVLCAKSLAFLFHFSFFIFHFSLFLSAPSPLSPVRILMASSTGSQYLSVPDLSGFGRLRNGFYDLGHGWIRHDQFYPDLGH